MDSQLHLSLSSWDGKHTQHLIAIYQSNLHSPLFFSEIITLYESDRSVHNAVTWLVKYHYGNNCALSQNLMSRLFMKCMEADDWQAQLHILQLMPVCVITEDVLPLLDTFVRTCIDSKNTFVRAWAYQGFFEIKKYIPEYQEEFDLLCERAMQFEKASVKARIRNIRK